MDEIVRGKTCGAISSPSYFDRVNAEAQQKHMYCK
jgi:hypothetical protein